MPSELINIDSAKAGNCSDLKPSSKKVVFGMISLEPNPFTWSSFCFLFFKEGNKTIFSKCNWKGVKIFWM